MNSGDDLSPGALQHAWGLLAAAELGMWPARELQTSNADLEERITLAMTLFDILPRGGLESLRVVAQRWFEAFPECRAVGIEELRTAARAALRQGSLRQAFHEPAGKGLGRFVAQPPAAGLPEQQGIDGSHGERLGAWGLSVWFDQMENSPRWRQLPNVIPGEAAGEIDDVFVELLVLPEEQLAAVVAEEGLAERQLVAEARNRRQPTVSVAQMVARTLEKCVVIGPPGSGKSTLVQWLTRAVRRGVCDDFDFAVTVKLGAYATALTQQQDLTLLEFFFTSLGTEITDWRPAAAWLSRKGREEGRILLLLDGWDEVPPAQRMTVRERIDAETVNFVTIITSRPAGLPREFQDRGRVDFYGIAGLAERARDELVRKTLTALGRPELAEPVLKQIAIDADLQSLAGNPFLLGLLVRVLAHDVDRAGAYSLAGLYRQITAWIREQLNGSHSHGEPLEAGHIAGLGRLAYSLLFEGRPRYVFGGDELAEKLAPCAPQAVLRSRFVNRLDPAFDEHAFLHATFTEYFAACQAARFSGEEFQNFLDRAFASASRLVVVEFLAGIGGEAEQRCRAQAVRWLELPDRFQRVLLKVARLATAGRWLAGEGRGVFLRDELWRTIDENRDMALVQDAVRAYAELDPLDLARRALNAQHLDNWAIHCLLEFVPARVAQEQGLDTLLTEDWADVAGYVVRGGASELECQELRSTLADPKIDDDTRRGAIIRAGAARDRGSVSILMTTIDDPSVPMELREQAIDSLGAIGDRQAVDGLVDYVLASRSVPDACMVMATHVLRHCEGSQQALDPTGRDRLLRRLAFLPADQAPVKSILAALEGFPIRDGGRLIGRIAGNPSVDASTRALAVRVLASVTDRQLLQQIVAGIGAEPASEVADLLLHLAAQRSLHVPLDWLNQKTLASRDRTRKTDLLSIYLRLLPQASARELRAAGTFWHELASRALADPSASACELASVLTRALSTVTGSPVPLFGPATLVLVRDELARFIDAPQSVSAEQIQLAAALVKFAGDTAARQLVARSLETALEDEAWPAEADARSRQRVAQALANTLVEIAPAELLPYSRDCAVVETALRAKALRLGWLVFSNRIVDAEGQELARLGKIDVQQTVPVATPEIADVINALPEKSRQVLRCYWSMVHDGGLCHRGDSHKKIYETAKACWDGLHGDSWRHIVESCLPEELPQWETWRKTLSRIEKQFEERPEWAGLLRRMGLYRRDKRRP